jgi:tetratricopeptide (TPR) repeat protein
MVDDSVLEVLAAEPHWRLASCPVPALLHEGYRPELLAAGDKAARLRQAMEAELNAHPGDPYACAKLGGLEVSEGNRERAIVLLEAGLAHDPPPADPLRHELLLHLALAHAPADPARAQALYRQALALPLEPRLTLAARLNLAALLLQQGDLQEAASLCRQATETAPEVALGWYNLGLIERRRGDPAAAISAYRRALALAPEHAEAHQNLAVALLVGGDIEGARHAFRAAIALLRRQDRSGEAASLEQRAGSMVKLER